MATIYKIHPAIGIARVGNSPDEFFIGPERINQYPEPDGGFKDAQCRVKRQAARFRIFAHHDDGTFEEIDDSNAEIEWTVHLVNKKATEGSKAYFPSEPASDLTIDPGTRTLDGPNQIEYFDTGQINFSGVSAVTVPLGEIRSDTDNHLLVLGGKGVSESPAGLSIISINHNEGWYDDISDGPVSATIKLKSDDSEPLVLGAWVLVGPPKFAPHQDSVISLYDRVQQVMIDAGLLTAPITTSYTDNVFPILQRAYDTRWVEGFDASLHAWTHPVNDSGIRTNIFSRLTTATDGIEDMPALFGGARLTANQYAHMERWEAGSYSDDWAGIPDPQTEITPAGMDRAALEACVGAAFFPGIEAAHDITSPAFYAEAFRLDHGELTPGEITLGLSLPWQSDFHACGDNWWPVPRPNDVFIQGEAAPVRWDRSAGGSLNMVDQWHELGFIVRQGDQHVEVDRCGSISVNLLTPALNFEDVPQGPLGMLREMPLAVTFEVISPDEAVELEYAPGGSPAHPQLVIINNSVTVGPTAANQIATARLWIVYQTADIVAIPQQVVTVRDTSSMNEWSITINANTVAHQTASVALVLDRSGSMAEDRGDGQSKHDSLQEAANIFVDVMLEGDGVGIVRYNQNAQELQGITMLGNGDPSDIARSETHDIINSNQLDPSGSTSIGDGIVVGRNILNTAPDPYNLKSLVVLTDGKENQPQYIEEVAGSINESTYAIGLGAPENTNASALQSISGNHGGFFLVTGAITQNNQFLLQKYFLQVLAGVSNAEVVLDPEGSLTSGQLHKIPFKLTCSDAGFDVILLSSDTEIIDFRLQTPNGFLIEPWRALAEAGMRYVNSQGVSYYRIVLPVQMLLNRFDQGGTWHALLTLGHPRMKPTPDGESGIDRSIFKSHSESFDRGSRSEKRNIASVRRIEVERLAALHQASCTAVGSEHVIRNQSFAVNEPVNPKKRRAISYSLIVHAYSSVSMKVNVQQSGYEPGARVRLEVNLTESGIPIFDGSAAVRAECVRPDDSSFDISLKEQREGQFVAELAIHGSGVYRYRVISQGTTRRGEHYTREQTLTAPVWFGGDQLPDRDKELIRIIGDSEERLCELLECLFSHGVISQKLERRLQRSGVCLDTLRKCLKRYCKPNDHSGGDSSGG